MRHGDKINNLGRTESHRRALLANMTISLIEHKRITTTLAKARALRRYAEPLFTKAKDNTTHSRRVVFSYLQNKEAVTELFGPIALKIADRPGGYLRIIKLGFRRGDGAETAMIELVDYNELYNIKGDKDRTKKTRRSRRGSGSGAGTAAAVAAPVAAAAVVEDAAETIAVEEIVDEVVVETPVAEAPAVVEEIAAAAEETVETAADAVEDAAPEAPAAEETKED
jgi:large subunit ribosomal protein L17